MTENEIEEGRWFISNIVGNQRFSSLDVLFFRCFVSRYIELTKYEVNELTHYHKELLRNKDDIAQIRSVFELAQMFDFSRAGLGSHDVLFYPEILITLSQEFERVIEKRERQCLSQQNNFT